MVIWGIDTPSEFSDTIFHKTYILHVFLLPSVLQPIGKFPLLQILWRIIFMPEPGEGLQTTCKKKLFVWLIVDCKVWRQRL